MDKKIGSVEWGFVQAAVFAVIILHYIFTFIA